MSLGTSPSPTFDEPALGSIYLDLLTTNETITTLNNEMPNNSAAMISLAGEYNTNETMALAYHGSPQHNSTLLWEESLMFNYSVSFFGEAFYVFNHKYRQVHGELSLAVCVFGIIANVLNIIVLSRKSMISATNAILIAIAGSDLVVIATYIPYVIHNFMRQSEPIGELHTYGWAVFTLLHAHISVVFHTISIWLTVLLAIWRYITVRSPNGNKSYCSLARAKAAIGITYLLVPCLCVPVFLNFAIYPYEDKEAAPNVTLYRVDLIQVDTYTQKLMEKINFWQFGFFFKLFPCILLTVLILALIRILIDAKHRKERLIARSRVMSLAAQLSSSQKHSSSGAGPTINSLQPKASQVLLEISPLNEASSLNSSYAPSTINTTTALTGCCNPFTETKLCHSLVDKTSTYCCCCCCGIGICFCLPRPSPANQITVKLKTPSLATLGPRPSSSAVIHSERTTRMLIVVLLVFLICEIPAGILALLSGLLGKSFFANVYNNFGELQDMLALINSAVNFVLYCSMSQQFRKTFVQLFCLRWTESADSFFLASNIRNISNFSPRGSAKPVASEVGPESPCWNGGGAALKGCTQLNGTVVEKKMISDDLVLQENNSQCTNSAKSSIRSSNKSLVLPTSPTTLSDTNTSNEIRHHSQTTEKVLSLPLPPRQEIIKLNDQIVIEAIGNLEEQKSNWL